LVAVVVSLALVVPVGFGSSDDRGATGVDATGRAAASGRSTVRVEERGAGDLDSPEKKEIALRIIASAENSSLDWRAQYGYIEDIDDGRGYTAGVVGFCSGTGDMLTVVREYARLAPGNRLAGYRDALEEVRGSDSHDGLDPGFVGAWRAAARDPRFQRAQESVRDRLYFTPAVTRGRGDGLRALGQFAYLDAAVMHGVDGLDEIRAVASVWAVPPSRGGAEDAYLTAFLDARRAAMRTEKAHSDTSRVDTAQRVFLAEGNFGLSPPLRWRVYGTNYQVG
jgi:chitosanase